MTRMGHRFAVSVTSMIFAGPSYQDRNNHQSGAVCGGHKEGPRGEITKAHTHTYPTRMSRTNQAVESKSKQYCSRTIPQWLLRNTCLSQPQYCDYQANRQRMAQGNWRYSGKYRALSLLLHA